MDHLPEWADFPCPLGLQEEPSLGEKDEESRFTPRADKSYQTSDQAAGYYFKQSSWGYNHLLNYESLDNKSTGNSFGDLPQADPSTRLYYLRANRGTKGPEHPNIQRSNELIHEKSKFNILRDPTESRKRMEPWDRNDLRQTPTELEKAAEKMYWFPLEANRPANAPLQLVPGHTFKKPENAQENSGLFKLMAIPELREQVVDLLHYEDLSNFSRASQTCFRYIETTFTHWDMTHRRFGNANCSVDDLEETVKKGGDLADKARSIMANGTASVNRLIVSPVRIHKPHKPRSFRFKANALEQLFRGIFLTGDSIHYLQLHRIEFLNVEAIEQMVDAMPNIKRLSILNCWLVHFGHTRRLIDLTARVNKSRVSKPQMDLDFYPMAHLGPRRGRHGSYHVLYQDDGHIDTRIAVVACLSTLIPYARKNGVELAMPGRAFRLWLDGFPFKYGTLEKILESIDNLEFHTPEQVQGIIDKAWEEGNIKDDAHEIALRRKMQDALHYDLFIATRGTPMVKKHMERLQYNRCSRCGAGLLAPYFRDISAHADERICHGCDLVVFLHNQYTDCLLKRNELAMRLWKNDKVNNLGDLMYNLKTPKGILAAKTWDAVLKQARSLDETVAMCRAEILVPPARERVYRATFGQQQPAPNSRTMAACWDHERRMFNRLLQTENRFIQNRGPHMGTNPQNWL